jgi:hypothetical protein
MSSTGRKRMFFATAKSVAVLVFSCVCLWAGYELYTTWQNDPAKLKSPVKSSPVKTIALRGENLVVDHAWVVRTLGLPKDADLMELDLYGLRERLLESGQVRAAVLSRKFPDTLVVSLEERSPVARLNARFGEGDPETFLVARDGVVFKGACFKDEVLQGLPFLGGVALKRSNGKLLPIQGMETVADLLNTARVNAPELYRSWSIVSLQRFATDGEIVVQSADVGQVIFGMRDDFYKQIARLDYILEESKKQPAPLPLKSINLAVGGEQVPVSFDLPTVQPADLNLVRPRSTPNNTQTARPGFRAPPTRPLQATNTSAQRTPSRRDF